MKKHYDKLLLLLGILLLAGGASVYVLKIGSAENVVSDLAEGDLAGERYKPKKLIPVADNPINWEEPPSQRGKGWKFDIFTPPIIYYAGKFMEEQPLISEEFGLKLESMENPPYHIQLKGIIPSMDPSTTRVLLYNNKTKESSGYKMVGNQVWGISIKSYMKEGMKNVVKVYDPDRGEELTIIEKQELFLPDNLSMVFKPTLPVGPEIALKEVGQTISSGIFTYEITEIDTASESVTVLRTGGEEDRTEVLTIEVIQEVKETKKSKKSETRRSRPAQKKKPADDFDLSIFDNL